MTEAPQIKARSLEQLVEMTCENHSKYELAQGYLRYEVLRRLSPKSFAEIYDSNLRFGFTFDNLIDCEIKKITENQP